MNRKKVAFITRETGRWIDEDIQILSEKFEVNVLFVQFSLPWFFSILKSIATSDAAFFWFGSLINFPFALFAKILGRKIAIVAGGFDVARLDEIHHGAFTRSLFSQWLRRKLFVMADLVLCVSASNASEAKKNIPELPHDRVVLVPLSVRSMIHKSQLRSWNERDIDVLMIASAKPSQLLVKGLDEFLKLVSANPHIQFCHLGEIDPECGIEKDLKSMNHLKMMGYVPFGSEVFLQVLNRSKVVVQLSRYESFCSSVIEAASLGAYPMVYDRFALPELVDQLGTSIPFGRISELGQAIDQYLKNPTVSPELITEHFTKKYSFDQRRVLLIGAMERLFLKK